MSVPIIYTNTQYIAGKHIFKTVPTDISLTLTSLTNVPTCNVMTLVGSNVGIGTTNPIDKLHIIGNVNATAYSGDGTNITNIVPIGTILLWTAAAAPTNYLICNGSVVSKTTYATLFTIIGTTYGAATATTFTLPDFRARVPVGSGSTTFYDANTNAAVTSSTFALGATGGEQTHALTADEMAPHTHTYRDYYNGNNVTADSPNPGLVTAASPSETYSTRTTNASTPLNSRFNLMNPYVVINYIIRAL